MTGIGYEDSKNLSNINQPLSNSNRHGMCAVLGIKFVDDVGDMKIYSPLADQQNLRNFPRGFSLFNPA